MGFFAFKYKKKNTEFQEKFIFFKSAKYGVKFDMKQSKILV